VGVNKNYGKLELVLLGLDLGVGVNKNYGKLELWKRDYGTMENGVITTKCQLGNGDYAKPRRKGPGSNYPPSRSRQRNFYHDGRVDRQTTGLANPTGRFFFFFEVLADIMMGNL
jgi:hypothetical protein